MKSMIAFLENLTLGKKLFLLMTPLISMLVSMKAAILGLWVLIFFDLLTGISKNLKERGIPLNLFKKAFYKAIRSYLLRQTWKKTYEYSMGIITIIIFESLVFGVTPVNIIGKTFTISELAVVFPAGVEVWSIYENLENVSGGNILDKIKNFLPAPLRIIFSSNKVEKDGKR